MVLSARSYSLSLCNTTWGVRVSIRRDDGNDNDNDNDIVVTAFFLLCGNNDVNKIKKTAIIIYIRHLLYHLSNCFFNSYANPFAIAH